MEAMERVILIFLFYVNALLPPFPSMVDRYHEINENEAVHQKKEEESRG